MTSPRDTPMASVETTTDTTLVLYNPQDFNVVMTGNDDIATGPVVVNNPPAWLVAIHDQIAKAHYQVREIAFSIG
ncbi:hypothetical protein QBC32DRAFT_318373 [Pseudoneurospora amorphoporcata]|uniref:Uncharacterized protein n=1 Tax=Pseudoneurospora amorphoporcata TaxID=241081 RepID=A0AAN6SCG5_9PEZI|nr:hypothetical protein QBC32DRAFT_318373 [Pseudoneurospora amorphoporcata]